MHTFKYSFEKKISKCNNKIKILLFKSYCQSIYELGLWCSYNSNIRKKMEVCYNNAFRFMLGLNKFCSASKMFVNNDLKCFGKLIRHKQFTLMNSILNSKNSLIVATLGNSLKLTNLWLHWSKSLYV